MIGASPAPGEADAVTFEVESAGAVALLPVAKVQAANVAPVQDPVPTTVLLTYRLAVAVYPVSMEFTRRLLVVLT